MGEATHDFQTARLGGKVQVEFRNEFFFQKKSVYNECSKWNNKIFEMVHK